jgi:hypothetical protein
MNQNLWGPKYWFTLHTISFEYPMYPTDNDKRIYQQIFTSFQHVLPCSVCRENYKKNLKEHPIENYLENRKTLVYWVIDIHNKVNVETGKRTYSYDEIILMYEKLLNNPIKLYGGLNMHKKYTSKKYITSLLILLIILLLVIIIKKHVRDY